MSVINRMLRELDARRAGTTALPGGVQATPRAADPRRLGAIVLLGAVAIGAAAFGDPSLLGLGRKTTLPKPVVLADAAAPPAAATPTVAAPASAAAVPEAPAASAVAEVAERPAPAPVAPRVRRAPVRMAALNRPVEPPRVADEAAPPDSPDAPARIDKQLIAMSPAQRAALAYARASELSAEGRDGQALERALAAVQLDGDLAGARQLAAVLLVGKNRLDEATALLRDGLQRQPQQPQFSYLLARLLTQAGDLVGALALLPPEATPGAAAQALRAGLLARLGRFKEAAPAYEAALRSDPDNAASWLGLGVALDAQGQGALAKQAFARARGIGQLSGDVMSYLDQKIASLP